MSDYQGKIRLSVQGLSDVDKLSKALTSAAGNVDRLADTKIQLRASGSESLDRLAKQLSAIETQALNLASGVSRIGAGATTVKFNARLDRQSLNRELDLVSRQFQRRNWRLNVNDTSLKLARTQTEKLGSELQELVSKRYTINVDYQYTDPPSGSRSARRAPGSPQSPPGSKGVSPQEIARRAGEAMASGLTGRLYSDAVASTRSSAARQSLVERFQQNAQRPQSPGGINQSLAQRYLKALGGSVAKGASPQEMAAEVERLLRTVDKSIIDSITNRVDELKLALQMPRNIRPKARALPNFAELLERMAEQTTRPAEASRMLKALPDRLITTDLVGLANKQASGYIGPDMIPKGGDKLFEEIKRLFTGYFKALNPGSVWTGAERKPYALQEIMAWQPWMDQPRSQRGQRLLPSAGKTARAVPQSGFESLQTSYDLESARRNISSFAKEVFRAQQRLALPPAGVNRALTPPGMYDRVVPVDVRDISAPFAKAPAVQGIFDAPRRGFAGGGAGRYSMYGGSSGSGSGGGRGGGNGFTPFGLLSPGSSPPPPPPPSTPFRRTTRRPDSAPLDVSRIISSNYFQQLTGTSVDERRRGQFSNAIDAYVRSLADAEQAQRSLNADVTAARSAVQRARAAYVEAGVTQTLTRDQVRGTRSGITNNRRANFALGQRQLADQIEALESQRAPIDIFGNYNQLQGLYGQLPITQRRGALRNLRNRRNNAMRDVSSEMLIGGAFPLLFGQGAATAAGGAIGGAASLLGPGAGFAGGLVGSAIGMQVDALIGNLTELATALKTPNDTLQALAKSGFYVSSSLEFQVKQLESVGRAYDAQTLVLQEVEKRLGTGSVRQLNALESEQRRLQEQWSSIAGTLQSELIPALVGFAGVMADTINAARGISSLPGAKQVGSALRGKGVGGAVLTAVNPLSGFTTLFDKLQQRGKTVAAGPAGNRQAAKAQDEFTAGTAQVQESRKIADQIQSAYREAFSLQREAYDLQRNGAILNRDIADYSYKKEREIFDLRQQAAEKQIENNRGRAQNRIEGSDLNARQTFAAAVGFEQQLLTNVREVVRSRKEGEADIEQSRNRLELAMAKLNRDVEDYKRTNAREIEDIEQRKLSYVRSVEDYKIKVADHVRDRTREAANLWKQAMTLPDMGAAAAPGAPRATTGAMMPSSGTVAFTGNTGVGTGAHLDARWADGRPITAADADRFIRVAGKVPSSFGITSGYGPRRAPTAGASSFHKGIDFGTPAGTPVSLTGGARLVGSMTEAQSGGGGIVGIIDTPMGRMKLLHLEKVLKGNIQASAATQISNTSQPPKFNQVPIGPTPSIAPVNAANMAARLQLAGGEKEALKILEEQNKLKQKGVDIGQVEQILQGSQLPQLKQQEDTLKQQIAARQKILDLSDNAASVADIEAESRAGITQLELDRSNALAKIKKQYNNDPALTRMVNKQADLAVGVAKNEEKQRRTNLDLNNKLQNQEQSRSAILQLQETLSTGKAEAAALERGELKATNVELLKASELYKRASDEEKAKLALLTAQTEELGKQNDFRRQINEVRNDARFTGAGLRAGMVGAPARAYEQGLKTFENDTTKAMAFANENKLLEDQQLIWGNLEKNIVDVSNAISGALTNGLVDIVDGSRKIQDVGRDMLKAMAGTFADSAQQQLTTLMQRQLGGLLGGSGGPLVKMLGSGAGMGGPEALGSASLMASSQVAMFGAALQAVTGQMAMQGIFSGSTGGLGSIASGATGGLSAALSGSLGNIGAGFSVPTFGGFLAGGGTTKADEGYVVGENGPEFFFPGASGRVMPNSAKQKIEALRDEGSKAEPIDIRYTVTEQRGERYVTEEQFRKGISSSSKRTQAMTYAGMRNNSEIRDFVNI